MHELIMAIRTLPEFATIQPLESVLNGFLRKDDNEIEDFVAAWKDHVIARAVQALRDRHHCLPTPRDLAEELRLCSLIHNTKETHHARDPHAKD